jgi:hypothetical protein
MDRPAGTSTFADCALNTSVALITRSGKFLVLFFQEELKNYWNKNK